MGDALERLAAMDAESAQTCVTSPPYWNLRDYGVEGQLGQEDTPEEYVENIAAIFREVKRVLRKDGTLWLNLGDSYVGGGGFAPDAPSNRREAQEARGFEDRTRDEKRKAQGEARVPRQLAKRRGRIPKGYRQKDLVGIPWMVARRLREDGWLVRAEDIWSKPNPMPESVKDRPTVCHETMFLLTRGSRYFYDQDAIRQPHSPVSIARARRNRFGGKYNDMGRDRSGALKVGGGYGPDGDHTKVVSEGGRNAWSVKEVPEDLWVQFLRWLDDQPERVEGTVWTIPTYPYPGVHFATYPIRLVRPCILAGARKGDLVLDPFAGAATTAIAALSEGRDFVGVELNPVYAEQGRERIRRWEANPNGELTGDPEPIDGQIGLELEL